MSMSHNPCVKIVMVYQSLSRQMVSNAWVRSSNAVKSISSVHYVFCTYIFYTFDLVPVFWGTGSGPSRSHGVVHVYYN